MVDDGPKDNGPPAQPDRPKRPPPTIDLEATEVPGDAGRDAAPQSEPAFRPPPAASPLLLTVTAATAGGITAALVVGLAWLLGWNAVASAPPTQPDTAALDALAGRIASIESKTGAPAPSSPDAATIARIASLEQSATSMRGEVAATRAQSEKLAGLVDGMKSAPREPSAPPPDLSAINERLAQIERAEHATDTGAAPDRSADDAALRRVVAAALLDISVRQGDPYAATLAAAKSVAPDANALKPLDGFADSGVPSPAILCREILTLVPKLSPPAPENPPAEAGIVDRLQAGASRLVRIQRTDIGGHDRGAVIARVTTAALRNDLTEARRELNTLAPADRAAAQAWIDKADARDAALAASRQFAADAMAALARPAL